MAFELPESMKQALAASPDGPLMLVGPETKREYVLVSASFVEHLQLISDDDGNSSIESRWLSADLEPDDWEDAANYD